MTKRDGRDEVWSQALQKAINGEYLDFDWINERVSEEVNTKVIHDTLDTMVDQGWLSKDSSQEKVWGPGHYIRENVRIDEVSDSSATDLSKAGTLEEGEVYAGEIDRFSNSGNANVRLPSQMDRTFINLGPINAESGDSVVFRYLETGWGECLTEKYRYEKYSPFDGKRHSPISSTAGNDTKSSSNSREEVDYSSKNPFTSTQRNKNNLLNGNL